jgi:hypothetical protein
VLHAVHHPDEAYDREVRVLGLEIDERESIIRVLDDGPEEFAELRAVLLREHVWRQRQGLA